MKQFEFENERRELCTAAGIETIFQQGDEVKPKMEVEKTF